MIGKVKHVAVLVRIIHQKPGVIGLRIRCLPRQPSCQVAHVDLNRIHDPVHCATVGGVAHFAFARIIKINGIKRVLVANGRRRPRIHLLQDQDRIGIVRIRAGAIGRHIVLPAKAPAQPIPRDSVPRAGGVHIFNSQPGALPIVGNAGSGQFPEQRIRSPSRISERRHPVIGCGHHFREPIEFVSIDRRASCGPQSSDGRNWIPRSRHKLHVVGIQNSHTALRMKICRRLG